jgi:predicted transcriptional regulator
MTPRKIHKDIKALVELFDKPVSIDFIIHETDYNLFEITTTLNELKEMNLIEEVEGRKYKIKEAV